VKKLTSLVLYPQRKFQASSSAEEFELEHNIVRWIHVVLSNWQIVVAQMVCIMRVSGDVCGVICQPVLEPSG
jgi:hypothetical protein